MRNRKLKISIKELKKPLVSWCKTSKQEWISAADMWKEINDSGIPSPFDSLASFRLGLRSLIQLCPQFIESRKSPDKKPVLFKITIKNAEHEEGDLTQQVEEERESYRWKAKYNETRRLLNHSHKENILQKQIIQQVHKEIRALPPVKFTPFGSKKDKVRKKEEAMLIISRVM